MNLAIGQGTDAIRFGNTRNQIVSLFGPPEREERIRDFEGYPQNRVKITYERIEIVATRELGVIEVSIRIFDEPFIFLETDITALSMQDFSCVERLPSLIR